MMRAKEDERLFNLQRIFILSVLMLLFVTLFQFIDEFIGTLFVSGVLVTAVYPVHRKIKNALKLPRGFSALISLLLIAVVILTPLVFLFFQIAEEGSKAFAFIMEWINQFSASSTNGISDLFKTPWVHDSMAWLNQYIPITASDLLSTGRDFVTRASSLLITQTTTIFTNAFVLILHIIIFLLSLFYFLKDGDKFITYLKSMLPLSKMYRDELMVKMNNISYGMIYGVFGGAIAQGFFVAIGFYLAGIENVAFWGSIAALLAPLPYIGVSIVWVPAVIYFLFAQEWLAAGFLFIWGAAIVSTVDNIVKPLVIGGSAALHPLAVMAVILGGAYAFGVKGLLFGPFLLTLTLSFLHIYSLEYSETLSDKEGVKKTLKKPTLKKKRVVKKVKK